MPNAVELCATELANCSHEKTKKVKKFGKKCALCQTRVWRFWKTRKCVDCKYILHKSCVMAWKKENAQSSTIEPPAATALEVIAKTVPAVRVTSAAKEMTAVERLVGDENAPLYVTPTLWLWANITEVTVDCRGRSEPLTVVVSNGYELSATTFTVLFDVLPDRSLVEWYVRTRQAGDCGQTAQRPDGMIRRSALPCIGAVERV